MHPNICSSMQNYIIKKRWINSWGICIWRSDSGSENHFWRLYLWWRSRLWRSQLWRKSAFGDPKYEALEAKKRTLRWSSFEKWSLKESQPLKKKLFYQGNSDRLITFFITWRLKEISLLVVWASTNHSSFWRVFPWYV